MDSRCDKSFENRSEFLLETNLSHPNLPLKFVVLLSKKYFCPIRRIYEFFGSGLILFKISNICTWNRHFYPADLFWSFMILKSNKLLVNRLDFIFGKLICSKLSFNRLISPVVFNCQSIPI